MNKVKKCSLLLIIVNILLVNFSFAQNLPDYFDRKNFLTTDSLQINYQSAIASEGVVNPEEYIVGPGDVLFISIRGIEEVIQRYPINFEGSIYIQRVGGIDLSNLTLKKAKEKIESEIKKNYKNVNVFISLVDLKKNKVGIFGDVKKSNTFILNGNARLSDLISISQTLNSTSNLRNIKIQSRNGTIKFVDLISYFRLGDLVNNPYLLDGDYVFIDKTDKLVSIYGNVKFPGVYEFKENESMYDLIKIAGGFLIDAKLDSIELISFANDNKSLLSSYYSYDEIVNRRIILKIKDKIVVRGIPEYKVDKMVLVSGFVKYPGYYKIDENKTKLSDIIKFAGGFLHNASLVDASVIRSYGDVVEKDPEFERLRMMKREEMSDDEYDYLKSRSRQRIGKVVVDFEELFNKNKSEEDILLKRNDVIQIPELKNYITIIGQVVNPGSIPYKENLTVNNYIQLSGGFGWRAIENDVRVIRANTGEWIDADDVDELKPGDTIWIPEDPPSPKFWTVFKDVLTVMGQIATVIAATVAVIVSTR